jgi:catechol-2,3-dioxygenase
MNKTPFIHHIELNATEIRRSIAFYNSVLAWLGFRRSGSRIWVSDNFILCIWMKPVKKVRLLEGAGLHHLAFGVETKEEVDNF